MPGVLPVPDAPTTAVQQVTGSNHELVAFTRRAMPTRLEAIPRAGTATCATVTPAPRAARSTPARPLGLGLWWGKSGNSPRRSSSIHQSGEPQSGSGCLAPLGSGDPLPPLADPLAGRTLADRSIVASACSMHLRISSRD